MGRWLMVSFVVVSLVAFALSPVIASTKEKNSQSESMGSSTGATLHPDERKLNVEDVAKSKNLADSLEGINVSKAKVDSGRFVQNLEDGRTVAFTMDVPLQVYAEDLLARYKVPAGAVVVLNSKTGRVLAFAQQRLVKSSAPMSQVALDPSPPAASLFKIVTAAALLEEAQVPMETKTCYRGGSSKLLLSNLEDVSASNGACADIRMALGRSINAVFAKLSDRYLDVETLSRYAQKFGFGRALPFELDFDPSVAEIPEGRLERARASAGFWHTHLSPLHAAMLAQSLAQDGAMLRPYIVDEVRQSNGEVLYEAETKFIGRTVSKETARALVDAMTYTVERGTARKGFRDRKGTSYLPAGVRVAGKTGTLTGAKPYRAYSWFTGVAPADAPEISIAVLIVNEPVWRIKSTTTAAHVLRKYFELHPYK